ncbi:hypothetical protein BY458DRAFT_512996 [Sporodiniella umbellata]|nr:hypothetical protein BY458DRAFT_512996 [Sporodiniella umbellata]
MEFKAILPADLFKIFSTTLDALSRLGDDVKINVERNQFVLSAINNSLTAQAIVRLSPLFFEKYELRRNQSLETALYCSVYAKVISKKNTVLIFNGQLFFF